MGDLGGRKKEKKMARRLPPLLRVSLLRPILQQRRPLPSPSAAHPSPIAGFSASIATVEPGLATATATLLPSAIARGPSFLFSSSCGNFCSTTDDRQGGNVNPAAAYSSSSSTGSSNIVVVESAEDFDSSLKKVQESAVPGIFYFTATWCGPCKFLAPFVDELSKMYPSCITYKIDIDLKGIESKLSELGISAVPTLNFYKDGKMAASVTGADVKKIKAIMDEFYN